MIPAKKSSQTGRKWGFSGRRQRRINRDMIVKFLKMHGLGNDMVVIDSRHNSYEINEQTAKFIGDRHRGVGFDQLMLIESPRVPDADAFARIFNPDGSEARACGNGTRCVADVLMRESGKNSCVIQTVAGLLECRRDGGVITINMGVPALEWDKIPMSKAADTLNLPLEGAPVAVNVGNPHCVFFCEDAEKAPVSTKGPEIERDPLFPDRVNVEFASVIGPDHLRMRVWERGAGITQACGSGACATAIAAIRRGLTGNKVQVELDGGPLVIEWKGEGHPVLMTGPVAYVFEGTISIQ
jgi:diaminopimelate epimerase